MIGRSKRLIFGCHMAHERATGTRFIEASIAYYRGKPIMSDNDYKELRSMARNSRY